MVRDKTKALTCVRETELVMLANANANASGNVEEATTTAARVRGGDIRYGHRYIRIWIYKNVAVLWLWLRDGMGWDRGGI
jgi:hypothetical protein